MINNSAGGYRDGLNNTKPKYGKMFKPKVMHWFENVDVKKDSVFQNTDFTFGAPIPTPGNEGGYVGTELYLTPDKTKIMINTGTILYLYSINPSNGITLIATFELPLTTAIAKFKIISADDDGALLGDFKSEGSIIVRYADFTSKNLETVTTPSSFDFRNIKYSYNLNIILRGGLSNDNDSFILNVTNAKYLYFYDTSNDYTWKLDKGTLSIAKARSLSLNIYNNTILTQTSGGLVYDYNQQSSPYTKSIAYIDNNGNSGTVGGITGGSSTNSITMAVVSDYIFVNFHASNGNVDTYEMWRFAAGDTQPVMLQTISSDLFNIARNSVAVGNLLYSYSLTYNLNSSVWNLPDLNVVKQNENYSVIPYFKSYLQIPYHKTSDMYYPLLQIHIDVSFYNGWIIPNTQIVIMPNLGICCFEEFVYI